MKTRKTALLSGLTVLAFSLAACAGNTAQSGASGDSAGTLNWEDSPLSKMFAAVGGFGEISEEEMQAQFKEQMRKNEEGLAKCMATEGFEYTPNDSGMIAFAGPVIEEDETDPVERARQQGYGFTTLPHEMPSEEPANAKENPNDVRYKSMSESEKLAYDTALYGKNLPEENGASMAVTTSGPDGDDDYNWEENGCQGKVQHELGGISLGGGQEVYNDPQWADLNKQMNELYEKAEQTPTKIDLDRKWANCMADAGIPDFKTPTEAIMSFANRSSELWDEEKGKVDAAKQKELQEEEIKVAVADAECQQKLDYQNLSLKARFALEQEFVDAHREELEAFTAALKEAGA